MCDGKIYYVLYSFLRFLIPSGVGETGCDIVETDDANIISIYQLCCALLYLAEQLVLLSETINHKSHIIRSRIVWILLWYGTSRWNHSMLFIKCLTFIMILNGKYRIILNQAYKFFEETKLKLIFMLFYNSWRGCRSFLYLATDRFARSKATQSVRWEDYENSADHLSQIWAPAMKT